MTKEVLISIKPKYVKQIFSGIKPYEFRRSVWKDININKVIVYSSSPEQKVVGEFEIDKIIYDTIDNLYKLREEYEGAEKGAFISYYYGKEKGYAIKIKNVKLYLHAKELADFGVKVAPQNFVYINKSPS